MTVQRTFFIVGAALAVVLVAAPSAFAQVASGHVTDGSTGAPVVGAEISLLTGSRDVVRRSVSDSDGRYSIEAPEPGAYTLQADFLGYERLESPLLNVAADRTVVVDFELPVDAIELEGFAIEAERDRELRQRIRLYGVRPESVSSSDGATVRSSSGTVSPCPTRRRQ